MRLPYGSRIWALQGGLSRNKVAVGESAAGSPPNDRDLPTRVDSPFHSYPLLGDNTTKLGHFRTIVAHTKVTPPLRREGGLITQR